MVINAGNLLLVCKNLEIRSWITLVQEITIRVFIVLPEGKQFILAKLVHQHVFVHPAGMVSVLVFLVHTALSGSSGRVWSLCLIKQCPDFWCVGFSVDRDVIFSCFFKNCYLHLLLLLCIFILILIFSKLLYQ